MSNLRANPQATIEHGGKSVQVVARAATAEEAKEILEAGAALYPGLVDYERRADRELDVFVLSSADG